MTISQALSWKKTLQERHTELLQLRNENSSRRERLFGEQQTVKQEPVYSVKLLDKLITGLAKEVRMVDEAIKNSNATLQVIGYERNEDVLGQVE